MTVLVSVRFAKRLNSSTKFTDMDLSQYPVFGGSKAQEYKRTIEHLRQITKEQDIYFVLAFLYDAQYSREDIAAMMDIIHPGKNSFSENLNKTK